MILLEEQHGAYWPLGQGAKDIRRREHRIRASERTAELIAKLAPRRSVCVQAGGHVGLWPRELAKVFDAVYTFEPDLENFTALARNCAARNIYAVRGALGASQRMVGLERGPVSGLHRVRADQTGDVPMQRVDGLGLDDLAALVLDVEGYEEPALVGATTCLKRFRPLVVVEAIDKHASAHGLAGFCAVERFLRGLGYGPSQPLIGADRYFTFDA